MAVAFMCQGDYGHGLSMRIDCRRKGAPVVTSRDVARVAGVSQSTVSYVMSGRRTISAETRKRVLDAIEQLTYQPNAGARALASQRTQVIGLVVRFRPGADTTGLLPFIETIAGCARAEDHDVLLVTADEGSAGLTRLAGRALCDAIVMMDIEADDSRIPVAATLRVPVILIGVPDDSAGLHCVDVDFAEAGRLARRRAGRGADTTRIVVIGHRPDVVERDINYVRRFQRGAAAAAEAHGIGLELVEPGPAGPRGGRGGREGGARPRRRPSWPRRPELARRPAGAAGPARPRSRPGPGRLARRPVHRRGGRGEHARRHERVAGAAGRLAARDGDPVPACSTGPGSALPSWST